MKEKSKLIRYIFHFIVFMISVMFFMNYIIQVIILGGDLEVNWVPLIGIGCSIGVGLGIWNSPYQGTLFREKQWHWRVLFVILLSTVISVIVTLVTLLIRKL